jgi:hypothetical protein
MHATEQQPFAEKLRTTGGFFGSAPSRSWAGFPSAQDWLNAPPPCAFAHAQRLGRWHRAIGRLFYEQNDIANRE